MRILDWKSLSDARARERRWRGPRERDAAQASRRRPRDDHRWRCAATAMPRSCALTRASSTASTDAARGDAAEFAAAERSLSAVAASRRSRRAIARRCASFTPRSSPRPLRVETAPGVLCERISVPVRAVGLYVPAGSAPLPSTAIMLAVPARIAGCPVRVLCTPPPAQTARADAAVLVAARKAGHRPGIQGRRRAGHRRHGLRHGERSRSATRSSGPAMPG